MCQCRCSCCDPVTVCSVLARQRVHLGVPASLFLLGSSHCPCRVGRATCASRCASVVVLVVIQSLSVPCWPGDVCISVCQRRCSCCDPVSVPFWPGDVCISACQRRCSCCDPLSVPCWPGDVCISACQRRCSCCDPVTVCTVLAKRRVHLGVPASLFL